MKYYLALPLLLMSLKSFSCSQKINESKIMLFVDSNFSDIEIETAKKAACQRGEKIVIVPKTYKNYTPQIKKIESLQARSKKCQSNCESINQEYSAAQMELIKMREPSGSIKDLITRELTEIKNKKGKVSNFIISGHDGGGNFGGHKGSVSREEISSIMNEFRDINEVSTLMLLGCYTGVQKEIAHWKGIFPQVRMIGGYDGSAPLSDKPMGHHYLEDLLVKEKKLLEQADQKQLNQYVKANIRGLHSMYTAVYLEPTCEEEDQSAPLYYGSQTNKTFSPFESNQCLTKAAKINEIQFQFAKFDSGEIEPPKNPSDPAIKNLYDQARSLEHCIEQLESPMSVNSLFNLRFYQAVKENFAHFYQDELKTATEVLGSVNEKKLDQDLDNQLAVISELEKEIAMENDQIANDPTAFFQVLKSKLTTEQDSLTAMLNDPKQIESLNRMQNPGYQASAAEEAQFAQYIKLKEEINAVRSKLMYRSSPNMLISINRLAANAKREKILASKESFKLLKENKIWLPTKENLQKHSRKELRDNIHHMSSVLTMSNIPRKTRLALDWAVKAQTQHLVHFQNPFEWHEVSARVTPPPSRVLMGEKIEAPSARSSGFSSRLNSLFE